MMSREINEAMSNLSKAFAKQRNKAGEANMLDTIKKLLEHPQVSANTVAQDLLRVIDPEGDLHHLLEPLLAGKSMEKFTGREWVDVVVTRLSKRIDQYRIKPEIVTIAGITIGAPYREAPPIGTVYYVPAAFDGTYFRRKWCGDSNDRLALEASLCFKSAADVVAAQKAFFKLMRGAE